MRSRYTIIRGNGADRERLPALQLSEILWTPDYGITAEGRFCHDDRNLYAFLRAGEKEIRAEDTEPFSPVHEDSCLEFFFMPEGESRYLNFEINPNGCLCLESGTGRHGRENLFRPELAETFRIRTGRTADGWEASFRIPAEFLECVWPGFRFRGILRANVYKCGDKTAHPHFLAWRPVGTRTPDFHRPEFFGEMVFGGRQED